MITKIGNEVVNSAVDDSHHIRNSLLAAAPGIAYGGKKFYDTYQQEALGNKDVQILRAKLKADAIARDQKDALYARVKAMGESGKYTPDDLNRINDAMYRGVHNIERHANEAFEAFKPTNSKLLNLKDTIAHMPYKRIAFGIGAPLAAYGAYQYL